MTLKMTVVITLMKKKACVAPSIENVLRVNSDVGITNAFPVGGAVIMIMTVVINPMRKTVVNINAG